MILLALRSVRHRSTTVAAGFMSMWLAAIVVMAFGALFDTANGGGVSSDDQTTLATMSGVVGWWGLVIAVFAVVSTQTVAIGRRQIEIGVLRAVGAEPRQVRRLVLGETFIVGGLACVAAVPFAVAIGAVIVDLARRAELVDRTVGYRFGAFAVGLGVAVVVVASIIGAAISSRRTSRISVTDALLDADSPPRQRPSAWRRRSAAVVLIVLSASLGVVTIARSPATGIDAMKTCGQASIWASLGLAVLAPDLVRVVGAALNSVRRRPGPMMTLAVLNARQRSQILARPLRPVILFAGVAIPTIVMQVTENRVANERGEVLSDPVDVTIEALNYVIVAIIVVFAALIVTNTTIATTASRRRELAQLRLAGATPKQVVALVAIESVVLGAIGIVAGSLASLATIVPFAIARNDSLLPDAPAGIPIAVAGLAIIVLVVPAALTTWTRTRTPAIDAVAVL